LETNLVQHDKDCQISAFGIFLLTLSTSLTRQRGFMLIGVNEPNGMCQNTH